MEIGRHLMGKPFLDKDPKIQLAARRTSKNFVTWNKKLIRRIMKGLRSIPGKQDGFKILRLLHDMVDHWDYRTTNVFLTERSWCPMVHKDFSVYLKFCDSLQCMFGAPKYYTNVKRPIDELLRCLFVAFSGSFSPQIVFKSTYCCVWNILRSFESLSLHLLRLRRP